MKEKNLSGLTSECLFVVLCLLFSHDNSMIIILSTKLTIFNKYLNDFSYYLNMCIKNLVRHRIYLGYVDTLSFDNRLRLSTSIYSKSDVF